MSEALKQAIQFLYVYNEQVIGVTIVLFLLSTMFFLLRSVDEKPPGPVEARIDINAIEGAMKRILESQPVTVAGGATPAASSDAKAADAAAAPPPAPPPAGATIVNGPELEALKAELESREKRITALVGELDAAKASGTVSGGGGSDAEKAEMKKKLDELQAKLAEYEIIEDDIADLTLYKEENTKLKSQLEELKGQLSQAQTAPPAPVEEFKVDPKEDTPLKFEKSDHFGIDSNDSALKEFTQAIELERAPVPTDTEFKIELPVDAAPAAGPETTPVETPVPEPVASQAEVDNLLAQAAPPETVVPSPAPPPAGAEAKVDKLAEEAKSMAGAAAAEEPPHDVLEADLNTDKLLAEAADLGNIKVDDKEYEDLLAEFNTPTKG